MKIAQLLFAVAAIDAASASSLGASDNSAHVESAVASDAALEAVVPLTEEELENLTPEERERRLQTTCWNNNNLKYNWHPTYTAGWSGGYCRYTRDCNSPAYSTQLACCKGAYAGQTSGYCLSQLPNPPTSSPTKAGGLDIFYPDYQTPWDRAYCINTPPLPSGRPTYKTMLACCKGAYAGQMSGKCLAMMPTPPTSSPTNSKYETDFWYPDYDTPWSDAGCKNKLPLPYNNVNDRPNYKTQLECCKSAYGGQMSGVCLSQLPSPPTTSPTGSGGYDFFYPDYDTPWSSATCLNKRPLPFGPGGRPTYNSMIACCKGAYAGQMSGACLKALPTPPTTAPTRGGGLDVYYPNYATWTSGTCINTRPLPNGRPTYPSKVACCGSVYGSQTNHHCMCEVNSCYSCNCGARSGETNRQFQARCNLDCGYKL